MDSTGMPLKIVAAELRAGLARLGWSQADLAANAEVSLASTQRYLAGKRDMPAQTLLEFARLLDIDLGDVQREVDRVAAIAIAGIEEEFQKHLEKGDKHV